MKSKLIGYCTVGSHAVGKRIRIDSCEESPQVQVEADGLSGVNARVDGDSPTGLRELINALGL